MLNHPAFPVESAYVYLVSLFWTRHQVELSDGARKGLAGAYSVIATTSDEAADIARAVYSNEAYKEALVKNTSSREKPVKKEYTEADLFAQVNMKETGVYRYANEYLLAAHNFKTQVYFDEAIKIIEEDLKKDKKNK